MSTTSSQTSSQLSTNSIRLIVEKLRVQKHRYTTRKNYYAIWKLFNKFFLRLDKKPTKWEERLVLFVAYLIETKHQSSTVKSYISAIRAVLQDNNIKINEDQYLINSLTKACRLVNDRVQTKLPIQKSMLEVLIRTTRKHYDQIGQPYLGTLYSTIFSTMYFGLFRIGELIHTASGHAIKACDVHLADNKRKILFVLRSTKTTVGKPQLIAITNKHKYKKSSASTNKLPCPYKLLKKYLAIRGLHKNRKKQFFVFADRSPVLPCHVRNCLKTVLKKAKFKHPHLYRLHGICTGRAQDLLDLGISIDKIMVIGRWKSNTIYRYLK